MKINIDHMSRIVDGKVMSEEEYMARRYGPLAFVFRIIQSILSLIQLFFLSIFNPQALTWGSGGRPGGPDRGGPKKPNMIHRIRPSETCRPRGG